MREGTASGENEMVRGLIKGNGGGGREEEEEGYLWNVDFAFAILLEFGLEVARFATLGQVAHE